MRPTIYIATVATAFVLLSAATKLHAESAVIGVAHQLGITPEALTLAGLHNDTDDILERIAIATDELQAFDAAVALLTARSDELRALRLTVREQVGDETYIAQVNAAEQAFQDAVQGLDAHTANMSASALNNLDEDSRARLARVHASRVHDVPAEFRVLDFTEREWINIKQALRMESRAQRRQELVPADAAALLATVRANPEIVAAGLRLELHLDSVEAEFAPYAEDESP